MKPCLWCSCLFTERVPWQRFCSRSCGSKFRNTDRVSTRGSVSIQGETYDALAAYCSAREVSISSVVEAALRPVLVKEVA